VASSPGSQGPRNLDPLIPWSFSGHAFLLPSQPLVYRAVHGPRAGRVVGGSARGEQVGASVSLFPDDNRKLPPDLHGAHLVGNDNVPIRADIAGRQSHPLHAAHAGPRRLSCCGPSRVSARSSCRRRACRPRAALQPPRRAGAPPAHAPHRQARGMGPVRLLRHGRRRRPHRPQPRRLRPRPPGSRPPRHRRQARRRSCCTACGPPKKCPAFTPASSSTAASRPAASRARSSACGFPRATPAPTPSGSPRRLRLRLPALRVAQHPADRAGPCVRCG